MIIFGINRKLTIRFFEIALVEKTTSSWTRGPGPREITASTIESMVGYVNEMGSPRNESLGIPSLTEVPQGQLKSTITLRSSESRFGTVLRGETTKPSVNGTAAKGPFRFVNRQ